MEFHTADNLNSSVSLLSIAPGCGILVHCAVSMSMI